MIAKSHIVVSRRHHAAYGYLWIHVRRLVYISVLLCCCMIARFTFMLPVRQTAIFAPKGIQRDALDRKTFQLRPSEARVPEKKRTVRPSLHLIGERHSGTNWIYNHLIQCFSPEVSVRNGLSRWKHWFQENGDYSLFRNSRISDVKSKMVVLAQFRNAYHWTEAMRSNPYHSPEHFELEWLDFVTRPWTMPRTGKDLELDPMTSNSTCTINKQTWKPHQVIPCLETEPVVLASGREVHAVYELRRDGSGLPYDSILDLRADKIQNFLSVAEFEGVDDFLAVQYEQNVKNGTASLIEKLEQALGVKAKCEPLSPHTPSTRPLSPDFVAWMKDHVDWETEALIGYDPDMF